MSTKIYGKQRRAPRTGVLANYFDRREAGEQLGRTPRTLIRWEKMREGPPVTRIGREPFYHRDSFAEWVRAQERSP
jgi:hypothetical protein